MKILQKKYAGQPPPSGDNAEDEKTLEEAASTVVAAALSPEIDGMLPPHQPSHSPYFPLSQVEVQLDCNGEGFVTRCMLMTLCWCRKIWTIPEKLPAVPNRGVHDGSEECGEALEVERGACW